MTTPETSTTTAPGAPPQRGRLWVLGLLLLAAVAGGYYYYSSRTPAAGPQGRGRFGQRPNEAVPVRVVQAGTDKIEVQISALGTVTPLQTVTVRSRIDGELVRVNFTEGQRVTQGDLLAEIDPRNYEALLKQAQGTLNENQARLRNAQSDLTRYERLAAEGLITRQQVSTQEALVQQYTGALQANEAQVNTAKVQLSYTKILAPIDGRLGLRQVDSGNLIRSGDPNGLVVITQVRPISVLFTVPESDLPAVLDQFRAGRVLRVQAWDRADTHQLAEGVLKTIDNQIDTATGTIKLRATFDNTDEQLFPNQFVNIRLRVSTIENATVIPAAAVQRASFGTFVYVVKPDKTVTIRPVTLGPTQGERAAVASGLQAGEQIVLEGVDDLTEGAKIEIITEAPGQEKPRSGGPPAGAPGGRRR